MSPFSFSILFSLQSSIPNPFPNDVVSTGILDGEVVLKHPQQERKLILRNLHSKASFLPTKDYLQEAHWKVSRLSACPQGNGNERIGHP